MSKRLVLVSQCGHRLAEPLHEVLLVLHGGNRAAGQYPVLDGQDLGGHGQRGEHRVIMLGDEARDDDMICETPVDGEGLVAEDGRHLVEASHPEDTAVHHRHGLCRGPGRIERHDLPRGEDGCGWRATMLAPRSVRESVERQGSPGQSHGRKAGQSSANERPAGKSGHGNSLLS